MKSIVKENIFQNIFSGKYPKIVKKLKRYLNIKESDAKQVIKKYRQWVSEKFPTIENEYDFTNTLFKLYFGRNLLVEFHYDLYRQMYIVYKKKEKLKSMIDYLYTMKDEIKTLPKDEDIRRLVECSKDDVKKLIDILACIGEYLFVVNRNRDWIAEVDKTVATFNEDYKKQISQIIDEIKFKQKNNITEKEKESHVSLKEKILSSSYPIAICAASYAIMYITLRKAGKKVSIFNIVKVVEEFATLKFENFITKVLAAIVLAVFVISLAVTTIQIVSFIIRFVKGMIIKKKIRDMLKE